MASETIEPIGIKEKWASGWHQGLFQRTNRVHPPRLPGLNQCCLQKDCCCGGERVDNGMNHSHLCLTNLARRQLLLRLLVVDVMWWLGWEWMTRVCFEDGVRARRIGMPRAQCHHRQRSIGQRRRRRDCSTAQARAGRVRRRCCPHGPGRAAAAARASAGVDEILRRRDGGHWRRREISSTNATTTTQRHGAGGEQKCIEPFSETSFCVCARDDQHSDGRAGGPARLTAARRALWHGRLPILRSQYGRRPPRLHSTSN